VTIRVMGGAGLLLARTEPGRIGGPTGRWVQMVFGFF